MRRFWLGTLFIVVSVVGQLTMMLLAVTQSWKPLFWMMLPGLYCMRFLPAYPGSAGSAIVFPTLAQLVLAIAVNTMLYAGIVVGIKQIRKHV